MCSICMHIHVLSLTCSCFWILVPPSWWLLGMQAPEAQPHCRYPSHTDLSAASAAPLRALNAHVRVE